MTKFLSKVIAKDEKIENPFKLGDILCCKWGSGMSLVDFYEVIKVTNSSVGIRRLEDKIVKSDEWGQSGYKIPVKKKYKKDSDVDGKLFRVNTKYGEPRIYIDRYYRSAELWNGKPVLWDTYD